MNKAKNRKKEQLNEYNITQRYADFIGKYGWITPVCWMLNIICLFIIYFYLK